MDPNRERDGAADAGERPVSDPDGFFRALVERAPYGAIVAETAADGRCVYANAEFTAITGYTLADVPTVAAWLERAYPDPDYRAYVLRNWPRDTDPDQMYRDITYRVRCGDGTDKYVQFRAAPLEGERMLVTLLDVSERTGEERALSESEQRYRALVETVPLGIAVHSAGTLDFVNPEALRLFGAASDEEILGQPVIRFVHPDSREVVAERMRSIYRKGGTQGAIEERFVRLDGTAFDAEVVATMVDFAGRPASLVLFSDITARKRGEAERRALEEQVRQAQKLESLGILAGGVAHDFNNLLVAILGRAEMARIDLPPGATAATHIRALETAARQAADLAHQMLAYAGQARFDVTRIDLRELVRDTRRLIEAAVSRRVSLAFAFADEPTPTEADATQVRQVLMNLVTNANEALEDGHGSITIRTGRVRCSERDLQGTYARGGEARPGPYVFLEVEDSGRGMDRATRQRMFEPFFSTKFTGRGLGLAAVLGIVRGHGGSLAVDSQPGHGTRIRVLFPDAGGTAEQPATAAAASDAWTAGGTILVVDDDPSVVEVAQIMLERMGFTVLSASDGVEGVACFEEDPDAVDLVLLDLTMPRLDGPETLKRLRAIRPDVRVLLSSGYGEDDVARRVDSGQVVGFVPKPYSYEALATAVRKAIED